MMVFNVMVFCIAILFIFRRMFNVRIVIGRILWSNHRGPFICFSVIDASDVLMIVLVSICSRKRWGRDRASLWEILPKRTEDGRRWKRDSVWWDSIRTGATILNSNCDSLFVKYLVVSLYSSTFTEWNTIINKHSSVVTPRSLADPENSWYYHDWILCENDSFFFLLFWCAAKIPTEKREVKRILRSIVEEVMSNREGYHQ
jgi:hypothetical protein